MNPSNMAYKKSDFKIKKENRISVSTQLLAKPDFVTGTNEVYSKVSQYTPNQKKVVRTKSASEDKCVLKDSAGKGNKVTNNNINNNKNNINKCINLSYGRNNSNSNLNESKGTSREKVDEFEMEGVCRLDGVSSGMYGISSLSDEVVMGNKKLVKRQKSVVVASRYMQTARMPLKSTSNNNNNDTKNNNNDNNSDSKKNSSNKDTEKKGLFCGRNFDTHNRSIQRTVSLKQPSKARQLFVRKLESRGQQSPTTLKQQHAQQIIQTHTQPIIQPTLQPGNQPSKQPTIQPLIQSTIQPHIQPTIQPIIQPAIQEHSQPAIQPHTQPTIQPTIQEHTQPTTQTHTQPTIQPTTQSTNQPHSQPILFQPIFTPIIHSKCSIRPSYNTTLKTSSFNNNHHPSHPSWSSSTPNFISSPQDMRLFSSMQSDDISHISNIRRHNNLSVYSLDDSELNQTTVNKDKHASSMLRRQSQMPKQSPSNKKTDPWLIYNRYVQYMYMEAKLQDSIKKQNKQAMDQIYKLWQLNDHTAAEAAELEVAVMKLRHQHTSDQVIDELHELLQPMNDKIDETTQLYETLLDKKELANHKALVKNIHLFDKTEEKDNNEEEDKKFHEDLQNVLEDTHQILSTMSSLKATNARDVIQMADIFFKLNDETAEGIECSLRSKEFSSKLHSLNIKENFLKLQFHQ